MIFQKHHWEGRFALPLWEDRKAIVAQAIGGERVFRDASHFAIAKTSFCEGVWVAWYDCSSASSGDPASRDASKVFEEYENPLKTNEVLETYCPIPAKRASLSIAREKAFMLGFRAARDGLITLWSPDLTVDDTRLTDHDRRTWASL